MAAERKSEILTIPVPKQVLAAVDRAANASWTSRSEFVRRAGDEGLGVQGLRRAGSRRSGDGVMRSRF